MKKEIFASFWDSRLASQTDMTLEELGPSLGYKRQDREVVKDMILEADSSLSTPRKCATLASYLTSAEQFPQL